MSQNQKLKMVIFDLDGTLTRERSIWEYIHRQLGKWIGFAEAYQKRFLAGLISYEEFCELDAQVWKGMRVEELRAIAQTVPFYSGLDVLIGYLKGRGLKLGLVSSGLSILSDWVHQQYGFDYSVANDLLHENGILTGKVRIRVYYDQKAKWVGKILDTFGFEPQECVAIGDSAGDIDMFRKVGFSVAFNSACSELKQVASVCVESEDLSDIIPRLPG